MKALLLDHGLLGSEILGFAGALESFKHPTSIELPQCQSQQQRFRQRAIGVF